MRPTHYRQTADELLQRVYDLGAMEASVIETSTIATAPWVRLKCQYGCEGFGSSLCCPPRSPDPERTKKLVESFKRAILFEAGLNEPKKIAADLEREAFLSGYYKAFGMGAGPCTLCKEGCAFEQGCRHPQQARPAMEACGIDVYATARASGFKIEVVRDREDDQHYFGLVLLD